MFEQTLLPEAKDSRKPYSMALSLLLQILVIGALCLVPFVFTQVLPLMQLKSVLAAPPHPPAALKVKTQVTRGTIITPRTFRLTDLLIHALKPVSVTAASTSEPAPPSVGMGDPNGVASGIFDGPAIVTQAPPPAPPAAVKPTPKKITVGGSVAAANLTHMVQPEYPPIARLSHIEGTVEFTATISKEGTIENLMVVHGHPLLINAAKEAVLQWRYRPTLLNGQPVEVVTDIVVNFRMGPA